MKQSFCTQKQLPPNRNNQELQFSSNEVTLLDRPFLRVSTTCFEEFPAFVWRESMLGSIVDFIMIIYCAVVNFTEKTILLSYGEM